MKYRNVREQVTDRLREEILLGIFKVGDPLREIPLAERFRVSRGPIRDALRPGQVGERLILGKQSNAPAAINTDFKPSRHVELDAVRRSRCNDS